MPDSAKSMISSKDLSKLGIRGQTSPTCPDRPRAERQKEKAAVKSVNEQTKCMNRNEFGPRKPASPAPKMLEFNYRVCVWDICRHIDQYLLCL